MMNSIESMDVGGASCHIYSNGPAVEVGGDVFISDEDYTSYGNIHFSDELFKGEEYAFLFVFPKLKPCWDLLLI